jgi:hypothetical protein
VVFLPHYIEAQRGEFTAAVVEPMLIVRGDGPLVVQQYPISVLYPRKLVDVLALRKMGDEGGLSTHPDAVWHVI